MREEVSKLATKRAAGTLSSSEASCILNNLSSSWSTTDDRDAIPIKLLDNAMSFLFHGADCLSAVMLAATRYVCEDESTRDAMLIELIDAGMVGGGQLDGATLRQLPVLRSVVMETLRLYPPIPLMHRTVIEPASLDEYALVPGQLLSYSIRTPHLDEAAWGDAAGRFCPGRHLRDGGMTVGDVRHDPSRVPVISNPSLTGDVSGGSHWLPFGDGVRKCPGADFATLAVSIYLAKLVMEHTLEVQGAVRMLRMPPHVRPDFELRVRRRAPQGRGAEGLGAGPPTPPAAERGIRGRRLVSGNR